MVEITRDTLSQMLKGLIAGLDSDVAEPILQDACDDQIHGNIANVANLVKPDGSPQKQNAPSTIRRKGHDIALRDSGALTNPDLYTKVMHNSRQASVYIPPSRFEILGYLDDMGYDYWSILDNIDGQPVQDRLFESFKYHWDALKSKYHG